MGCTAVSMSVRLKLGQLVIAGITHSENHSRCSARSKRRLASLLLSGSTTRRLTQNLCRTLMITPAR